MKIAIAGGSGFVGKHIAQYFAREGHKVVILSRSEKEGYGNIEYMKWMDGSNPAPNLEGLDVMINLAGKSISSRWTEETKKEIVESRVESTREVFKILNGLENKPSVFINASAVGIYGTSEENTFTEDSDVTDEDFLSSTVQKWEQEASMIRDLGIRTVYARLGIVLGEGGVLQKMILPYKLYGGGPLGSGNQWMSWIHVTDIAGLMDFIIQNDEISGPINMTSPNPVQMETFGKTLGKVINKPHWLPAPSSAIKLALGEMSILLLEGQRVLPKKAIENGYTFIYPSLEPALSDIIK
ncbi:TIGR01777 family oxidoreductase [Metabacillus sp. KIGAM252]|uniref:TIGR01777 family oxidoreductase n=1 Tax=Metabacillus flavus TaxID=2823519 RepID=A0ABS5LBC3_9BACI|nr:TIGR01777 family oxidoreductase [Metabacillus flavus]MBS2967949.1 TIGR01777 family oxidoreductase [Metabacillus flavus]